MIGENFFNIIRPRLFRNDMSQSQVDGCNYIYNTWPNDTDKRYIANSLGQSYHETDYTMQPIEEYGRGANRPYGKPDPITHLCYYGRGYVQLTWKANYEKMGLIIGVDLVNSPERALDPEIAAKIMIEGMTRGIFTGRKLGDYFNNNLTDWYNARRIINGLDCATAIEGYSKIFFEALNA